MSCASRGLEHTMARQESMIVLLQQLRCPSDEFVASVPNTSRCLDARTRQSGRTQKVQHRHDDWRSLPFDVCITGQHFIDLGSPDEKG